MEKVWRFTSYNLDAKARAEWAFVINEVTFGQKTASKECN